MEIIILGFILFIIGVGATIVYDKYKDQIITTLKTKQEQIAIRNEAQAKFAAAVKATTAPKKSHKKK